MCSEVFTYARVMQKNVDIESFRKATDALFPQIVADLKNLVSIPGIAWPSYDQTELSRSANAVADLLKDEGFDEVNILAADGAVAHPAVIARRKAAPGYQTVLLYAHHDVQPPGAADQWSCAPFEVVERDGRLYGRGVADDKAGIMVHIGALRVLRELMGRTTGLGITVFIEGEEEAGSPHFGTFLQRNKDVLAADVIVIADSINWAVGTPTLTTGLRGVVGAEVTVRALDHALHSGAYGGPILDAPTLLARLLATLHTDQGVVAIDGLVSGPDPAVEYSEEQFRRDAGVLEGVRLAGQGSITGRLWNQPAISVTGIDCTAVEVASNTIAPSARAKLSLRIAPGQDPVQAADLLRTHLVSHAPFGAHVEVVIDEYGAPFSANISSQAAQDMMLSLEQAWGRPAVQAGIGGSIPFTALLKEAYPEAAILITGVEDPDTRAHGVDESLDLGDFRSAITAEALWLTRCAQSKA